MPPPSVCPRITNLTCLQEPALFAPSYDAFAFHNLPTPQPNHSPEAAIASTPMPVGGIDSGLGGDLDENRISRTRSSSEEKDSLTPAQSRRKAQNRAAYVSGPQPASFPHVHLLTKHSQRAFRERKERHVRDLENKLSALETSTHSLQSDNERLKLALQRARTENEILRATSGHSPTSSRPVSISYPSPGAHLSLDDDSKDDEYSVQSFNNGTVVNATSDTKPAIARRKSSTKEVPAAQAWDIMQSHPLVQQGLVDITDVCERLKGTVKCDGQGPVFEESAVWQAVEESRRSGGDELI